MRNGFRFTSLDPSFDPVVNLVATGVTGLQFGDGGIEIQLPADAVRVTFQAGAWAEPVDVTALDPGGSTVASTTMSVLNALGTHDLRAASIRTMRFAEGSNEGVIVEVCAHIPVATASCVSFAADASNTQMGPQFVRNGFRFTSLDPSFDPVINAAMTGVPGLQFGDGGLEIELPTEAASVTFEAGAWAQPVEVTAQDSSGATVANATVPQQNALGRYNLMAAAIRTVTFSGGLNEGLLQELCIDGE